VPFGLDGEHVLLHRQLDRGRIHAVQTTEAPDTESSTQDFNLPEDPALPQIFNSLHG
jgi:hypothetical protein